MHLLSCGWNFIYCLYIGIFFFYYEIKITRREISGVWLMLQHVPVRNCLSLFTTSIDPARWNLRLIWYFCNIPASQSLLIISLHHITHKHLEFRFTGFFISGRCAIKKSVAIAYASILLYVLEPKNTKMQKDSKKIGKTLNHGRSQQQTIFI